MGLGLWLQLGLVLGLNFTSSELYPVITIGLKYMLNYSTDRSLEYKCTHPFPCRKRLRLYTPI